VSVAFERKRNKGTDYRKRGIFQVGYTWVQLSSVYIHRVKRGRRGQRIRPLVVEQSCKDRTRQNRQLWAGRRWVGGKVNGGGGDKTDKGLIMNGMMEERYE